MKILGNYQVEDFDEDIYEMAPPYLVYPSFRDGKRTVVVEVQDGPSDWIIWNIKDGKMIETFNFEKLPF